MSLNIISGPYLTRSASWELFKLAGLFAFLCRTPEEEKPRAELNRGPSLLETGGSILFLSAAFVYPGTGAGRSFTSLRGNEAKPGPRVWFETPAELVKLVSAEFSVVQCRICIVLLLLVLYAQFGFLSVCNQTSAIRFGELGEVPSLLVVSDRRIYFLEITSEIQ